MLGKYSGYQITQVPVLIRRRGEDYFDRVAKIFAAPETFRLFDELQEWHFFHRSDLVLLPQRVDVCMQAQFDLVRGDIVVESEWRDSIVM
jgi:hypothetical protein